MARQAEPWRRGGPGGPWYAWIGGKQVRLADGSATKADAWTVLHHLIVNRPATGTKARRPSALTAGEVLELWIDVRADESPLHVVVRLGRFVKTAQVAFGAIPAATLTPGDVHAWLKSYSDRWNPSTRSLALATIKSAFSWARQMGRLERNPLADMKGITGLRREAVITPEEYDRFLATLAAGPFRDLIVCLHGTGARPRELATLTIDRVDLAGRRWDVLNKTHRTTGARLRPVYLSAGALAITRRLVAGREETAEPVFLNDRGNPWTAGVIAHRFARTWARAGMREGCTAYALRHLFITDFLERGVPPLTVVEMVGHQNLKMIMKIYNRLCDRTKHLIDAIDRARPDRSRDQEPDRDRD